MLASRPSRRWVVAVLTALVGTHAVAQPPPLPARVTLVVPYMAGGPSDRIARALAAPLGEALGRTVQVENRPGDEGAAGTASAASAPRDGSVLLFGTAGTMVVQPAVKADLPYQVERDFDPVALCTTAPLLLLMNAKVPARNLDELVRYARANPDVVRVGFSGGGLTQLASRSFARMAGIRLKEVPYDGSGPQLYADLLQGRIDLAFESATLPLLREGQVRILGVSGQLRLPSLPQVPTVSEAGVPGFEAMSWTALYAPRGTPAPVVRRLSDAVAATLARPDVASRLEEAGVAARPSTPEQLARFARQERTRWAREAEAAKGPR